MPNEENVTAEGEFVYLLLHYKELVERWLNSDLKIEDFDVKYQDLLEQIKNHYEDGFLLTRDAWRLYICKYSVPKEEILKEIIFTECWSAHAKKDDYAPLEELILSRREVRKRHNALKSLTESIQNTKDK